MTKRSHLHRMNGLLDTLLGGAATVEDAAVQLGLGEVDWDPTHSSVFQQLFGTAPQTTTASGEAAPYAGARPNLMPMLALGGAAFGALNWKKGWGKGLAVAGGAVYLMGQRA